VVKKYQKQTKKTKASLDKLTESQREQAAAWVQNLEDWERFRASFPDREARETDKEFAAILSIKFCKNISVKTLYNKRKAFRERGAAGLADGRGRHGKQRKTLTGLVWDIFQDKYLDGRQPTVAQARYYTELEIKKRFAEGKLAEMPIIPSVRAFQAAAERIPLPLVMYHRKGLKAYIERCEPYIRRLYDMAVNDFWVCDNHTFDVFVRRSDEDERLIRAHLTAFIDARSRKITGFYVTENPNSQATIYALRRGILAHGKPKAIYADNGREFTAHDVGGRGYRKKKNSPENEPTILKNLEIGFMTAQAENARAKLIERAFRTVKEQFSRLFDSYTGGSISEKPDGLEYIVKKRGNLPTMEEFGRIAEIWIEEHYNNRPHSGEGMNGQSPNEVFSRLAPPKEEIAGDELNELLMRWSNKLKVGKNGVTINFYGRKLQYNSEELWLNRFGEAVYVRYDPDNLQTARIYDREQRFLCVAELETPLGYAASKEEIQREQAKKRAYTKLCKEYKKAYEHEMYSNLSLVLGEKAAGILQREREKMPRISILAGRNKAISVGGGERNALIATREIEKDFDDDTQERFFAGLDRLREIRRKEGFYDWD
jgi:transposase InsO family protein